MTGQPLDLSLKADGATLEAWQKLARKTLGDALGGVLGTHADWPLADASGFPGAAPFTRGTKPARTRWDIRTLISQADAAHANAQALEDITGGATSLWIDANAFGAHPNALAIALKDVPLGTVAIALDGADIASARSALKLAVGTSMFLGLDDFARTGRGKGSVDDVAQTAKLAHELSTAHALARAISIDTRVYHKAGATPALELAAALASGVAYLRALEGASLDLKSAARQIAFILVTDANFVASLAKLRAFRHLWARVLEACNAGDAMRDIHVTAVSSEPMMTRHDAYSNILRATLAGFAGAVGGADAIALTPFDTRQGSASDEARRIARNTQSILLEEANLARATDPAGGAFVIEHATEDLAQAAWRPFQEIEALGGMAAGLKSGWLAERIYENWKTRRERIAMRDEWITGISDFPLLSEAIPPRAAAETASGPFAPHRLDDDFEALRAASDAFLETHGERPKIYLVAIGSEVDAAPRLAFARSLFESGGIEAVTGPPTSDAEGAAAAFLDSGIALAALCSCDAIYAEKALAFAHEVKRAGARYLYFIGAPCNLEDALRDASVDEFVPEYLDAIALLKRAHETLGLGP